MAGDGANNRHVVTDAGVTVEKTPQYRLNAEQNQRVELSVTNDRSAEVVVGIVDLVSRECELSALQATTGDRVEWRVSEGEHAVQLRIWVAGGESRTVLYTFESVSEAAFSLMCERRPRIE